MLAIADFVPGDVDKNQMIADYVNDQIDVVGQAFLGLSVACARCHDHKFDPISTEDYYALAGIFFSTRIIPGPVPGNTPLVRVPLLSPTEIASELQDRNAPTGRRRAELEQVVPDAAETAPIAIISRASSLEQTARYLVAACECRAPRSPHSSGRGEAARPDMPACSTEWVAFLDRIEKDADGGLSGCAPRRSPRAS